MGRPLDRACSLTLGFDEDTLVSTPRSENATLEPIAYAKQSQVKLSSAAEATPTPATTGIRQALTCHATRRVAMVQYMTLTIRVRSLLHLPR